MKLPLDLGVGISLNYNNKLITTFDIKKCNWKNATLDFNPNKLTSNISRSSWVPAEQKPHI